MNLLMPPLAACAGKLALITGAGAGLGAQMARRFHEEGAEIVVNDLRKEAAEAVAKEVAGIAIAADVSDSAAVTAMFEQVDREKGRLDFSVRKWDPAGCPAGYPVMVPAGLFSWQRS